MKKSNLAHNLSSLRQAKGLSQEKAEGSILYGWMIHAAVNIVSPAVVFLFLL